MVNGVVTTQYRYLDANDEEKYFIAQASAEIDDEGHFKDAEVPVRRSGDYRNRRPRSLHGRRPKQVLGVAASLIRSSSTTTPTAP